MWAVVSSGRIPGSGCSKDCGTEFFSADYFLRSSQRYLLRSLNGGEGKESVPSVMVGVVRGVADGSSVGADRILPPNTY